MNKQIRMFLNVVLIAALLPATVIAASYKWTDKEGRVHYSDNPPPGVNAVLVKEIGKPSVDPNKAMEDLRQRADNFNQRHGDRRSAADDNKKAKDLANQNKEICESLQKNLKTLTENIRLKKKGADGKDEYISGDAREKEIQRTKQRLAEEC